MRRTVLAVALVSLSLSLTGCGADDDPAPPTASETSASAGAEPSTSALAGPTPVPTGKTFAWPDGIEATATVSGRLRPADRTDLQGGVVDEARLEEAREKLLGRRSEPLGLRVKLTNTGDAPVDLDKVELQWVGVKVGGMAQKATDDGGFKGELAPGESATELSAWVVPDIVAVGYQVLVWPQGARKGMAGQFSGVVPDASVRPPDHGDHGGQGDHGHSDHSDHSGH
ncbi:hypothetical protein [Streptomyces megasporus]|uniref:hypothetical protein n=1 Tax=Streptomyces megasporus TaxID=44060 RepID=UPI00068F5E4F|nr:hypothetical protein [Streptomyces megasporus]